VFEASDGTGIVVGYALGGQALLAERALAADFAGAAIGLKTMGCAVRFLGETSLLLQHLFS
jgi:hypothetical protein